VLSIRLILYIVFTFWLTTAFAQTNISSGGLWGTPGNWSLAHIPLATENVIIPTAVAVTANAATDVCLSLTINGTGSLAVSVNQGLTISGNLSNAGSFTLSAGAKLTFNGITNSIVSGTGSYTITGTIVMNLNASTTALDIQSASFIAGINTGAKYYFTFVTGTWIMDNPGVLNDCYNSGSANSLVIPYGVVIQSNAGTMNLAKNGTVSTPSNGANPGTCVEQSNVVLSGELFMNGGTVDVMTGQAVNSGRDFQYHVTGGNSPELNMVSGNLFIGAGFNYTDVTDFINFQMTGGTLTCSASSYSIQGTFALNNLAGGITNMTAGTIIIQEATDGYFADADLGGSNILSYNVTGGTIQFGNASTAANTTFAFWPYPTTNYPNFVLLAGAVAKTVQPYNSVNFNLLSLTINSNFTFDMDSYNAPSGAESMNLSGTTGLLINSGMFTQRTSTVLFTGTTAQTIGGTTPGTFYNLTIANGIGGSSILSSPETVTNSLTLTSGIITTTAAAALTLTAGSSATSGNAISFINGPMTKIGNTAFVFPLGAGSNWARLGITAPASVANQLTAEYFNSAYGNTVAMNLPLTNVSTIEYWTLSETVPGNTVNVSLFWQNAPASGIKAYTNTLRVAHWNGASWADVGQSSIIASSPGEVTSNAVSSFSPFTFGSTSIVANPLPIELVLFTSYSKGSYNAIFWKVATQTNNAKFILEKSADALNWTIDTTIAGAGTTTDEMDYSYTDENPYYLTYYRLSQIDFDGKLTLSDIISVISVRSGVISCVPNPFKDYIEIKTDMNSGQNYVVTITDMIGSIVLTKNIEADSGVNSYMVNTIILPAGTYIVHIQSDYFNYSKPFIKT